MSNLLKVVKLLVRVSSSPTKQPNLVRVKQYFVTLFKIWSNEKETIYRESKVVDNVRAREWQEHRRDMSVTPKDEIEKGTQIDLLIDRQDMCINLCEIKYSLTEFTIEKKYAEELNLKRRIFLSKTGTKKTVFITMLTTFGVKENGHYLSTVQNQLTMDVLFERM